MSAALLLAGPDGGEVRYLRAIRVAHEPPVLELERIKVNRAPVNDDHNSELALSARHAGTVALHLLYRELNRNDPVTRLWFDIEPPSTAVTGRSAELFFGLATYLHLGRSDLPAGILNASFMATGTLDRDGNVGSVEHVSVKVRAALTAHPAAGTRLFYPRADEGQIDDTLRMQCRDQSLLLCPVDRIDEALAALGVPIIGSWPSSVSPFRSLQAFETSFSRVFFGRQREVAALATLLETRAEAGKPGALIIGASGAGKSSFCLAGLIPALAKSRSGLEYAVWRPRDAVSGLGDSPAEERHFAHSIAGQWQMRDANQPGLALARPIDGIDSLGSLPDCLAPATSDGRIFIVDQFEELFTLAFTAEARIAFARFLQSLQAKGVWVIGTLRSEFYPQYLELADADGAPMLTQIFEGDGQYNLPRMSREALAQVIVRPAELAGLRFEQRSDEVTLAQALLADAMATDDALPLLGFALQTLYDDAERPKPDDDRDATRPRTLTFAAYARLGGLSGAIGVVAARAYGALDPAAQAELPALLSALAVPSPDGSRETARPATIAQWPVGSPGRRLIDALTDIRVLVSDQGLNVVAPAQVRVAHEALFSHWDVAAQQLNESRQSRLLIEDFRQRAKQWNAENRPREALLSGPRDIENARLARVLMSATQGEDTTTAFVDRSIARARRKRAILYASAAAVALVLAGSTGWAIVERDRARESQFAAEENARAARDAEAAAVRQTRIANVANLNAQQAAAAERRQRNEANRQRDLALAATRVATEQRELAEAQTLEARRQRSRAVAQLAEAAIEGGDAMTGILLARSQLQPGDEAIWTGAAQTALLHGIIENREVMVRRGTQSRLEGVDFTSDGSLMASAPWNGPVLISSFENYEGMCNNCRSTDIIIERRTMNTELDGSPVLLHESFSSVDFSHDGQRLAIGSTFGYQIFSINGNSASRIMEESANWARSVRFSPDGNRLAITDGNATKILNMNETLSQPIFLIGHTSTVADASFSHDGEKIVTVSWDNTARVWTLEGDQYLYTELVGHRDRVVSASFSTDDKKLVTSSWDGTARVWSLGVNEVSSFALSGHRGRVIDAKFSHDGRHIVTVSTDGNVRVWRLDGDESPVLLLSGHGLNIISAEFTSEGQGVTAISEDGTVIVWRLDEYSPTFSRNIDISYISQNEGVTIWHSVLDGIAVRSYELVGQRGPVTSVALSSDGRELVTGSADGTLQLWSLTADIPVLTELGRHASAVQLVEFGIDGKYLVSVSDDRTYRLWTVSPDTISYQELSGQDGRPSVAAVSPDGKRVLTGSSDGSIWLWTIDRGRATHIELGRHEGWVRSVAFSPDGRLALTSADDGTAKIWRTDESRVSPILLTGSSNASFSPDGRRVVTTLANRSWVWTFDGGVPSSVQLPDASVSLIGAWFSDDGQSVMTRDFDGVVRRWYVPFGQGLLDYSAALLTRCLTEGQLAAAGLDPSRHSDSPRCQ